MRSSRTPEHRSGSSRLILLVGLFILVVGLGLAITYFTQGFGSLSAETTEPVPAVTETEALGQSEANTAIVVPEGSANEPSSDPKIEPAAPEVPMNESDEAPKLEPAVDVEAKPGDPADTLKIEDIKSAETDAGEAKAEDVTDEQAPHPGPRDWNGTEFGILAPSPVRRSAWRRIGGIAYAQRRQG